MTTINITLAVISVIGTFVSVVGVSLAIHYERKARERISFNWGDVDIGGRDLAKRVKAANLDQISWLHCPPGVR